MRRQNESPGEMLFKAPWWISVVIGVLAFVVLRWGLGACLSTKAALVRRGARLAESIVYLTKAEPLFREAKSFDNLGRNIMLKAEVSSPFTPPAAHPRLTCFRLCVFALKRISVYQFPF